MKIYKFKESINPKEVGGFPQLWDIDKKYDFSKPDSIHAFKEGDDFFLDSIDFSGIKIPKRGFKQTDLISTGFISYKTGLFVSQKFKILLERFNLPRYKFYELPNFFTEPYYFLNMLDRPTMNACVDYQNSIFYSSIVERYFSVSNFEDYMQKNKNSLHAQKLVLNSLPPYDIFIFRCAFDWYITEPLKAAIVEAGITGVQISDASDVVYPE